jgi:hypothetical protein
MAACFPCICKDFRGPYPRLKIVVSPVRFWVSPSTLALQAEWLCVGACLGAHPSCPFVLPLFGRWPRRIPTRQAHSVALESEYGYGLLSNGGLTAILKA